MSAVITEDNDPGRLDALALVFGGNVELVHGPGGKKLKVKRDVPDCEVKELEANGFTVENE